MQRYGWRPYFIALGAAGFLWIPLWLARMPRSQRVALAARTKIQTESSPRIEEILLHRSAWGTFLGHFGGNYFLYFLLTWLPYYLVHERQFSLPRMGKIGALAYMLMAVAGVSTGYISDRLIESGRSATVSAQIHDWFRPGARGIALAICAFVPTISLSRFSFSPPPRTAFNISNVWVIPQILAGPRATGRWVGAQTSSAISPAFPLPSSPASCAAYWQVSVRLSPGGGHVCSWRCVLALPPGPVEPVAWPSDKAA